MDEISSISTQARQNRTFRRWYDSHRDQHNKLRKKRYQSDPEYREKAKLSARRSRARRKERGGVQETTVIRIVNGKEVKLFRVSAAAEMIGKSADTIRSWSRQGYIPSAEDGAHRTYELYQIELMRELVDAITKYRYVKDYQKQMAKVVEHIYRHW